MATGKSINLIGKITEAVEEQIRREVNKVFEAEKERIIAELETVRSEVVAKAALRITKYMDVQQANDRLVISLDLREG